MVEAGVDLFGHRGLRATMVDVADLAAVPRGSIYHHFPNGKSELVAAVAAKLLQELARSLAMAAASHDDPVAFLRQVIDDHAARLAASGYHRGWALLAVVASGAPGAEEGAMVAGDLVAEWSALIAAALENKGFEARHALHVAEMLVTLLQGCNVLARAAKSNAPFIALRNVIPALA